MHNLFIGSSSEALPIARAVQANLSSDAEVSIWNQAQFAPTITALESLTKTLDKSDFAVFVFAADDLVTVRDETKKAVRDNVLVEIGLFLGKLGRNRVAIVMPSGIDVRVPSDLQGISFLKFAIDRSDGNLIAALGPASDLIRMILSDLPRNRHDLPPDFRTEKLVVKSLFGTRQQRLLQFIELNGPCITSKLSEAFPEFSQSELYYRLEHLRLLCFISPCGGKDVRRLPLPERLFELHESYREVLHRHELGWAPVTEWGDLREVGPAPIDKEGGTGYTPLDKPLDRTFDNSPSDKTK